MIDKFTVIDSHCHIYPAKIASAAAASTSKFYSLPSHGDGTVGSLLEVGTRSGIDRFVVHSVATTPKQVNSINSFIAEEVSKNPEKLIGLGAMHPNSEDMETDIKHLIALGLHGVKMHPEIQNFSIDDPKFIRIFELCEKYSLPILLHTGDYRYDYSNPNKLLPIVEGFKNLTIIGAHFGGWSLWEEAWKTLAGKENFYVDCSSSLYAMTPEKAVDVIRHYGADRVMFGSDYPLFSPDEEIERFMALELTDEERRMILGENVLKVYGIK